MLPYAMCVILVLLVFLSTQRVLCHCAACIGNLHPYVIASITKWSVAISIHKNAALL